MQAIKYPISFLKFARWAYLFHYNITYLCFVFQHDFSELSSEVLELGTHFHTHSTLLALVLVIVNSDSNLASSQWSCILQKITCVGKFIGFPAPRNSSTKPRSSEWDVRRSISATQVAASDQIHLRWNCQ